MTSANTNTKTKIEQVEQLKQDLWSVFDYQDLYQDLLDEYDLRVQELKLTNHLYIWEQIIDISEQVNELEKTKVFETDEQSNSYSHLLNLLGIMLK